MKLMHWLCLSATAIAPMAINATQAAEPDMALPAQSGGVEEVIVTAQKRAENLQRVPIAVTALSGDQLTAQGVTNSQQLNIVSPGLNIRTTAGAYQPSIRGIGTSSNIVENPVALYIDGVYIPQQREGLRELYDISQIAVLKGPQGTLFGRNATAGVIQITTLDPSHDFRGEARVELDNYLTTKAGGYVTGGINEKIAASISASIASQKDGWGENLTTGKDTYRLEHDIQARTKILFEPGDRTKITLAGDYMDRRQITNSYQPYQGLPLSFAGVGPLSSVYDTYAGTTSFNATRGGGVSLTVDQELSFAKLVSISAYRSSVGEYQFDNTGVPASYFVVFSPKSESESYTQEFQLISPENARFNWVAGLYYIHYANGSNPIFRFFNGGLGSPFVPATTSAIWTKTVATETTESIAPFGQATWEFLSHTRLTLGARWTYERRSLDDASIFTQRYNGSSATVNITKAPLNIYKFNYRASLDHDITDDIMAYVSFNTGIKSGGFNIVSPANNGYLPEKLTAYEAGLKMQLFDRRLRLNLAAFYYEYTNLQVIQFVGLTQTVINGPAARLYGLDVDFEARLSPEWKLSGGIELENPEFTKFPGAVHGVPRTTGGATLVAVDAKGNRLPLAQNIAATLAIDYHRDFTAGALDFNLTGNYNGDYYFEADNFTQQKAYLMLNTALTWTLPGDRVSISIWGKNLLDEKIITQVPTQTLGWLATYGSAPLTYGTSAVLRF